MPADLVVPIQRLPHALDLSLPAYATDGSAGVDLVAALPAPLPISLAPMTRTLVATGICIMLPRGFEAQIRPRSGLAAKHGITVLNAPGTIDSDYRGEIKVLVINLGADRFVIERGMRIAQMIVAPVTHIAWQENSVLVETRRGVGGFGSTGVAEAAGGQD